MRARMALRISGAEHELRDILLRDKPDAMLAASPKGTVPVLVLPDGTVLEQSLDIMVWALGRSDPEGWLADADMNLIARFDGEDTGGFKHHLDRYKYAARYDSDAKAHRAARAGNFGGAGRTAGRARLFDRSGPEIGGHRDLPVRAAVRRP